MEKDNLKDKIKKINFEQHFFSLDVEINSKIKLKNFYKGFNEYFQNRLEKWISNLDDKNKEKIINFFIESAKNEEFVRKLFTIMQLFW